MKKRDAGNPDEELNEGRYLNLEKRLHEGGERGRPKRRDALERGTEDENDEKSRLQKELRRESRASLARKRRAGHQALRGLDRPADWPGMSEGEAGYSDQQSVRFFGGGFFSGENRPRKNGGRSAGPLVLKALGEHADDLWWPGFSPPSWQRPATRL